MISGLIKLVAFICFLFLLAHFLTHPGLKMIKKSEDVPIKMKKFLPLIPAIIVFFYVIVSFFPGFYCPLKYKSQLDSKTKRQLVAFTTPIGTHRLDLRTSIHIINIDERGEITYDVYFLLGKKIRMRYSNYDGPSNEIVNPYM